MAVNQPNPLRPPGLRKQTPSKLLAQTSTGAFGLEGLLPSQAQFVFCRFPRISYTGSWGSGKSVALCIRMLTLLSTTPYSRGFIGRLHASDLRNTTMPIWEEVVPATWIKSRNRNDGIYTLKNNSQCIFGHLHDPVRGRQHLASLNVAHIGIDQAEEVTEGDYIKLTSRARYRADLYHSVFLVSNPAGHNWIWRRFYQEAEIRRGHPKFESLDWLHVKERSLGIAVPIDENDPRQGGYLPADYIPNLRAELPPEYAARYLDCSFEDFEGKVYPAYRRDSIHNIDEMELDPNWSYFVGVDIGGASPWAVLRCAVDFDGRIIVYDELYQPNMGISEVNRWICRDPNWWKAVVVIDPENRAVVNEFHFVNARMAVRPARKAKMANIARVNTYMQLYTIKHISGVWIPGGSPRIYITKNCVNTRREHDERLWKPSEHGENKPEDGNDHTCDALEYVVEAVFTPTQPESTAQLMRVAKGDAGSAQFWQAIRKKEGRGPESTEGGELFEALKPDRHSEPDEFEDEDIAESFWGGEA